MAEATETGEKGQETAKAGGGGKLGWIVTAVLAGGLGVAIPYVLPASFQPGAGHTEESAHETETPASPAAAPKLTSIEFDEVVVNLDEGRLNRYLDLSIELEVSEKDKDLVTAKIAENKAKLKNWLLSYLSDQDMEDVRGAIGQNRLRREIRDQFNTVLFPDGYDRIENVYFTKFAVQ
jgi:flagellar basal body-associated protein FliL